MIRFVDFFKLDYPTDRIKVKFNMNAGDREKPALDFLLEDGNDWIVMNAWRTKHSNNNYGNAKFVIALAQYYPYGANYFLFGGIYKIGEIIPKVDNKVGYKLTLLDDYKEYRKRLIIKIKKSIGRNLYNRKFVNLQKDLEPEIYELSPDTKLGNFPGYDKVSLKHKDLQRIISNSEPIWKNALSKVKGVYVITDCESGELYIGSASGHNEGLWQRWSNYAHFNNLTGGNKDFKQLKQEKGEDYIIKNFKYSIIEIFDMKTSSSYIINRESYWKKVFETRKFGLNNN